MPQPSRERRRPPATAPTHRSAKVTRVDATGVYVTPLRGDTDQVIGPCRGGWRRHVASCSDTSHNHPLQPLPLGAIVLLITIPRDTPWIVAVDEVP